jgi:hypothetical protein
MRAMGSLVALSPLYYVTSSSSFVSLIAPFDYFANGIIWCGYWLGLTTLLYRSIPANTGVALCFSIYTAAAGFCGAVGSILGGKLAVWLAPWGGFKALWVVSSALRFAVAWGLYELVSPSRATHAPAADDSQTGEPAAAAATAALVSETA